MTWLRLLLLLTACPVIVVSESRNDVPFAPLPARIATAQKVFLTNGGDALAYDAVYAAFKQWPRFTIVDSAAAADVSIEVGVVFADLAAPHHSHVNGRALPDPPLLLTIFDSGTRQPLWSSLEHRRLALKQANRDKETIAAANRLIANLRLRLPN